MTMQHSLLDEALASAEAEPVAHSFFYLLTAYFLPRGLFLDPEAHGSWNRWASRRHNIAVLRLHSLAFARRWLGLWLIGHALGSLIGGTAGTLIMLAGGMALMPAMVFVCARLAANIVGDDLPL
jgi:hypothetical protein